MSGPSSEGKIRARTQAVPAPPNPLWAMPSPINAQRRETTKTERVAQATASADAQTSAGTREDVIEEIRAERRDWILRRLRRDRPTRSATSRHHDDVLPPRACRRAHP